LTEQNLNIILWVELTEVVVTRKGIRVKIIDLTKRDTPCVECGSVRIAIKWLDLNGLKPFHATYFSNYFNHHPDRVSYVPDHREYAIVRLED